MLYLVEVSAPIDIIEITKSGAAWIRRDEKSMCPR